MRALLATKSHIHVLGAWAAAPLAAKADSLSWGICDVAGPVVCAYVCT